jgi:uncharacterized protein
MNTSTVTPFSPTGDPPVRGFLHVPPQPNASALALTHGAGGNCQSKLLVALAEAFAASGFTVLRFDLPFRIDRRFGPPRGNSERDREGLRRAVTLLREKVSGHVYLAGHSYGGRQATMLIADDPAAADGLLLFSYPLHPPNKPQQLRTAHLPKLSQPCFFVHGTRDPFGTIDEMQSALALIPAPHVLLQVEDAAHDLLIKKDAAGLASRVAAQFPSFVKSAAA